MFVEVVETRKRLESVSRTKLLQTYCTVIGNVLSQPGHRQLRTDDLRLFLVGIAFTFTFTICSQINDWHRHSGSGLVQSIANVVGDGCQVNDICGVGCEINHIAGACPGQVNKHDEALSLRMHVRFKLFCFCVVRLINNDTLVSELQLPTFDVAPVDAAFDDERVLIYFLHAESHQRVSTYFFSSFLIKHDRHLPFGFFFYVLIPPLINCSKHFEICVPNQESFLNRSPQ